MHKLTRAAAAAALLALPLTACGGGSSTGGDVAGANVTVHAKDTLSFDKSSYSAPAGNVTIGYVDDGASPHTLRIEGQDQFKLAVNSHGQKVTGSINLAPGSYTIFCDIPGHRAAGMQATLTVK